MIKKEMAGYIVIFRAYITRKDGTRLYARQRGKKAFPIVVPAGKSSK